MLQAPRPAVLRARLPTVLRLLPMPPPQTPRSNRAQLHLRLSPTPRLTMPRPRRSNRDRLAEAIAERRRARSDLRFILRSLAHRVRMSQIADLGRPPRRRRTAATAPEPAGAFVPPVATPLDGSNGGSNGNESDQPSTLDNLDDLS